MIYFFYKLVARIGVEDLCALSREEQDRAAEALLASLSGTDFETGVHGLWSRPGERAALLGGDGSAEVGVADINLTVAGLFPLMWMTGA